MQTNNDNNEFTISESLTDSTESLRLRRGKNDAYESNIISIDPYHCGKPRLQTIEKRKFQNISGIMNPPGLLEDIIEELEPLEYGVWECYTDKFEPMSSIEFVEMMLLDSYFIIQQLQSTKDADNQSTKDAANLGDLTWIAPLMLYDLLLLENQLPFFLIISVFDIVNPRKHSSYLINLAFHFFRLAAHRVVSIPKDFLPTHLHQLYHWFIISTHINRRGPLLKKSEEKEVKAEILIPNTTVLHEVGIKFKKKKGRHILDVKFNGGVLEIPPLFIHDGTVSLFKNLIVLEHCNDYHFREDIPHFTAYFKFMDHIINTVSDVALLQKNGIIENSYGSETEVALLFNQLTCGATIDPDDYLSDLYKEVNKYRKKKRHICGAIFLRRHCSNPLTIISIIGFLFLLALTFIQSYFAVYAYFRPPS